MSLLPIHCHWTKLTRLLISCMKEKGWLECVENIYNVYTVSVLLSRLWCYVILITYYNLLFFSSASVPLWTSKGKYWYIGWSSQFFPLYYGCLCESIVSVALYLFKSLPRGIFFSSVVEEEGTYNISWKGLGSSILWRRTQ